MSMLTCSRLLGRFSVRPGLSRPMGATAATDRYKAFLRDTWQTMTNEWPDTRAEVLEQLLVPQALLPGHHAPLPTHPRITCTSGDLRPAGTDSGNTHK